ITGTLGQGGMGIVYSARDERLGREVALKTMTSLAGDETARKRFWREARAAASVNHPNICQLYEIGEENGELFIAMELLEGESLAERLKRGSLNVSEALPVGLGILAALSALHARGIVHRDLKPSNVFLTPHGVKLLDFGLARPTDSEGARPLGTMIDLTSPGMMMGTPRYMSPEQITGEPMDARSDLFATGAILFESLSGRPAFSGRSVVEIMHATLHEQPPALTGSPAVAAVDRVIRRAMAKRPADRPSSADAMADELRAVRVAYGDETPAMARALTRLVVLPFRVLRPDPETDFLAFSLPDAISSSLSAFSSLVLRSSASATRFQKETPDLKALAAEADVDRVVMGTLLRSGDQVQATAQLVEAPGGTLLSSHTVLASLGDLFKLQDDIARRVVEALSLPLTGAPSPTPDRPHDASAYALYLRANELALRYEHIPEARELYLRCVEMDPRFAPAWAQLGRCHRVIAKYIDPAIASQAEAEKALARALELNPRLAVAHKYYAALEADMGQSPRALTRLLGEASRHGNDPELFAGLVHACRYAGLFEQSIAAHHEARRLDPNIPTSVDQTIQLTPEFARSLEEDPTPPEGGADAVIRVIKLGLAGRREEARRDLLAVPHIARIPVFKPWTEFLLAWLERRTDDMVRIRGTLHAVGILDDPEAMFQEGWLFCDAGDARAGLALIGSAIGKGYFAAPTLSWSKAFDPLRSDPTFRQLLADAEAGRDRALATFREAGGERLLGLDLVSV
ncbi:MAG TPA: protein kinase, partial [Candidatus Eisenbacteria bacterium]|nr:protein kinase [Candidatus Eisenbacteria bacterium]